MKTKKAILKGQRPKIRGPHFKFGVFRKAPLIVAFLSVLTIAFAIVLDRISGRSFITRPAQTTIFNALLITKIKIIGALKDSDLGLGAEQLAFEYLRDNHGRDLGTLAKLIAGELELRTVRIMRTGIGELQIYAEKRTPIARVDSSDDHQRFLDSEGVIFGRANSAAEDLPTVTGFPVSGGDSTMTAAESRAIEDVLELIEALKADATEYSHINFIKHRGFSITLKGDSTEVFLGNAPYNVKITRMHSIILDLRKKGSQAQRIELDYDGKAFIKEKAG